MYIHQGTTFKRSHAIYSISADDQLVDQTVIFCEKIYVWVVFFYINFHLCGCRAF